MKLSSFFITFACSFISMVLATTATDDAAAAALALPYPVGLTIFGGNFEGHDIDFNGSIEGLVNWVQAIKPGFNPLEAVAALTTRAAENKEGTNCCPITGWSWGEADAGWVIVGISYLLSLGTTTCGVAARSCARVSCSNNAAIYLCNDNNYFIFPNCGYIASYAQDLVRNCHQGWTCGQEFDTDNYNVIVRKDNC